MIGGMPKTLLTALVSCTDPGREREFNDWYDKIHIPDVMENPSVGQVYRYRNLRRKPKADDPGYLALCGIESNNPYSLLRKLVLEDTPRRAAKGRMIDCLKAHFTGMWELISCQNSPAERQEDRLGDGVPRALFFVLSNCTDPTRDKEFNDWYSNIHVPDLLQGPGIVRACRYRNLKPKLKESDAKYLNVATYRIDKGDPWDLAQAIWKEDQRRAEQGRMIDCAEEVFFSAFEHIGP